MEPVVVVVLVVLLLVVVAAALVASRRSKARREHLRSKFGPEYERTVSERGRRSAEQELADRERRHDELQLRPLPPEAQQAFVERWRRAQSEFVNDPKGAVEDADTLTTEIMRQIGYPTQDYSEQVAYLSVEHAAALEHYRAGHAIAEASRRDRATTEELRQALVHYRALVGELLGVPETQ